MEHEPVDVMFALRIYVGDREHPFVYPRQMRIYPSVTKPSQVLALASNFIVEQLDSRSTTYLPIYTIEGDMVLIPPDRIHAIEIVHPDLSDVPWIDHDEDLFAIEEDEDAG